MVKAISDKKMNESIAIRIHVHDDNHGLLELLDSSKCAHLGYGY